MGVVERGGPRVADETLLCTNYVALLSGTALAVKSNVTIRIVVAQQYCRKQTVCLKLSYSWLNFNNFGRVTRARVCVKHVRIAYTVTMLSRSDFCNCVIVWR